MPAAKKSSKKKAAKAAPKPETPAEEQPSTTNEEDRNRWLVHQDVLDAGYAVVAAGEDENGHWFLAERDGEQTKIYVKEKS
jgi:hypothetical protein